MDRYRHRPNKLMFVAQPWHLSTRALLHRSFGQNLNQNPCVAPGMLGGFHTLRISPVNVYVARENQHFFMGKSTMAISDGFLSMFTRGSWWKFHDSPIKILHFSGHPCGFLKLQPIFLGEMDFPMAFWPMTDDHRWPSIPAKGLLQNNDHSSWPKG